MLALLLRHLTRAAPWCSVSTRQSNDARSRALVYRNAVHSSHSYFVKAMSLRWLSLVWLVSRRGARRVWALHFWSHRSGTMRNGINATRCSTTGGARCWLLDRELDRGGRPSIRPYHCSDRISANQPTPRPVPQPQRMQPRAPDGLRRGLRPANGTHPHTDGR